MRSIISKQVMICALIKVLFFTALVSLFDFVKELVSLFDFVKELVSLIDSVKDRMGR